MAAKEVKKEAQKEVTKKGRRLKRSVRKSLGAVFLASAIAVAAIPTEGLQAAGEDRPANRPVGKKVTAYYKNWNTTEEGKKNPVDAAMLSDVPVITEDDPIYTTGDSRYQFAFTYPDADQTGQQVAVILRFNYTGNLDGGVLEVPNNVDAYKQYDTGSTAQGYAAVNRSGEFLYYPVKELTYDENGDPVWKKGPDGEIPKDDDGKEILEQETHIAYKPCYYDARADWEELGEGNFYYRTTETTPYYDGTYYYALTGNDAKKQRIHDATVAYIGNQYLKSDDAYDRSWTVDGFVDENNREKGAFANKSNIRTLKLGKDLSGIGDYAFYNCAAISSVELGNGMTTIGNHAFANCIAMTEFKLDFASNLRLIGDHAFYNCYNLKNFTLATAVQKLGDSAFENCRNLTEILLNGVNNDGAVLLDAIGYDVFKGCRSLESITFPESMNDSVDVTTFEGCTSLQFIATESSKFDIIPGVEKEDEGKGDDPQYTLADFKSQMSSKFYFKGPQTGKLHDTATANEFAYSYYDKELKRDVYELTVTDSANNKAKYQVDSNNELVDYEFGGKPGQPYSVDLPATIGPYGISTIGEFTFQNNCDIIKIVIPGTITKVEQNAFRGCHNLKNVIWDNPNPNLVIAPGAFKTQDVSMNTHVGHTLNPPVLNFVGPISDKTSPFLYAMDPSENINYGNQALTYITYYSGWPSNLEVRYDPVTDKNTLVDYPTFKDLGDGKYKIGDQYAYITKDYQTAALNAAEKYRGEYEPDPNDENDTEDLTQDEQLILGAVFNIVLPTGIEAIATVDEKGTIVSNEDGNALGLFEYRESHDEIATEKIGEDNILRKTITAYGLTEVADRAFAGCKYLSSVTLAGNTQSIGTHAFEGCVELINVSVPATVSKLGVRPFAGCTKLSDVNFGGGPYFTCEKSIIFKLGEGRNKEKLVEFLCGRSGAVKPDEVAGILELYPEAFMGTKVGSVDLSSSFIEDVPVSAFQDTLELYSVTLPEVTCKSISMDAFSDSGIKELHIPDSVTYVDNDAFRDELGPDGKKGTDGKTDLSALTFECAEGSAAAVFADRKGIKWEPYIPTRSYTVTFLDWDELVLKTETVEGGNNATPPTEEEMAAARAAAQRQPKEGWTFTGDWDRPYTNVRGDVTTKAVYVEDSEVEYTIIYYYDDFSRYTSQTVKKGKEALPISAPESKYNPGAKFDKWVITRGPNAGKTPVWTNIQSDLEVIAVYEGSSGRPGSSVDPDDPNASKNPDDPNASDKPDDPNASKNPNDPNSPGSSNPNDPNGSGSSGSGKRYILTVQNGSGSGSYAEGDQPVIIANDPASGQEFDYWSISPADVKIASTVLSASVITMPAKDVTVTAHFKAKSGSSGSGSTGSGNNAQRPNGNSGIVTNGGTTVVIDKNGLSNTGVVSATVHGSSDNFTIKISESAEATEAALRALMAEYGDNLDNIKFFPMDISLYDSTGTTKIKDTTGLSVSITLPIPDSLTTYAGNNRVASVANDRLERLSARFTTIQGVSCITFTAEHFSPYVIYVNTSDLSSGLVSDSTPKTGDFIHPKWFLSIALACLSFVFFIQRDTKKQKKVKVKVRA